MTTPIALICSVPLECRRLVDGLARAAEVEIGRKAAWTGVLDGAPVIVFPAGMGKTNAAQGLTALLETRTVRGVIGFGVGGAYDGSGLRIGDVALASRAVYGDEGVEAPGGWMSTEGIGIPLIDRGGRRVFNEIVLDAARVQRAADALTSAGVYVRVGPFVTVSACSGTAARGAEMAGRIDDALCEGMEGAALAHVAAIYDVPFLELRAVSNLVEDRDLSRWRLAAAAEAAQRAVRALVAARETVFAG
ncbi:futalosine hydrolase [Longimicrobium sp.]|uniref:futalosine hydrolase n=1 Tax=Longimicrobium sp. TaxID=2029185 RepID=UPI002C14F37B|nr:futalosine hydrolase [Longimicrobium sp.]HSU14043.1 futalosine hydrolase [Longimicrobium sp.]